jgi:hypothetical protein
MFAFLFVPGPQKKLQVIFDNSLDGPQITFSKSAFAGYFYRVKPEFRFLSLLWSHERVVVHSPRLLGKRRT